MDNSTSKIATKMNLAAKIANERHSATYKGCQKYKEVKLKARAASYAEALKNKPENQDKERAQKKQVMLKHKSRTTSKACYRVTLPNSKPKLNR